MKFESLNNQVDEMKKVVQKHDQLKQDLQDQQLLVSQLKEQHFVELGKQKTKLDDACKHYQSTLIEEQSKLQLKVQELEVLASEVSRMQSATAKKQEELEMKMATITELQSHVSSLTQQLAEADLEVQSLKKSQAEASHLLSLAQNTASKIRSHDAEIQPPQLISSLKASSAGIHSIKNPAIPIQTVFSKKSIQNAKSFNPSASPPSAAKHRESPKTKKRDRAKVPCLENCNWMPFFIWVCRLTRYHRKTLNWGNFSANKTANSSNRMKRDISEFLLGWSKAAGYHGRLHSTRLNLLKCVQEPSQKKKTNTADASQHQQGGKNSFFQASNPWKNDSKFKGQRKGNLKKAKTSDSEFDIFS
jgi:hypothetical protein